MFWIQLSVVDVLLVDELASDGGNVVDDSLGFGDDGLVLVARGPSLRMAETVAMSPAVETSGILPSLTSPTRVRVSRALLGLLTSLGISQVVVVLVESRHQLGQERSDNLRVLDKLAHVVDNDSRLSLDGGLTLSKTTLEQRNHDGESGLVDVSDESGGTEQVNGLGDVLWLGDTLDELGNEPLDILVDDQTRRPSPLCRKPSS